MPFGIGGGSPVHQNRSRQPPPPLWQSRFVVVSLLLGRATLISDTLLPGMREALAAANTHFAGRSTEQVRVFSPRTPAPPPHPPIHFLNHAFTRWHSGSECARRLTCSCRRNTDPLATPCGLVWHFLAPRVSCPSSSTLRDAWPLLKPLSRPLAARLEHISLALLFPSVLAK